MRYRLLVLLFAFFFVSVGYAQDEECSAENREACAVDLTLYCPREGAVPLNFRLNDAFDIEFTAQFSEEPRAKRFPLYFVDGQISTGAVREQRITTLRCSGNTCSGTLTLEKARELEADFDFGQAVINVVLRDRSRFGRDFCLGKFTNNPELVEENNRSVRQVCSLVPAEGEDEISGSGFFVPGGYGTDGDSQFHLAVQGLPTTRSYHGCALQRGRYRKVFSFQSVLLDGADDEEIYGDLTLRESDTFNANRFLYSYNLRREVSSSINGQSELLFTPSLSLINKSVSTGSGSSTIRKSNKANRKKRRRARRRRQKNKSSRRSIFLSAAQNTVQQEVLDWLNFDPLADIVVLSRACGAKTLERALGTLVCGSGAESATRQCRFFDLSESDAPFSQFKASVCREFEDGVGQLILRIKGSEEQTVTVCVDDAPLSPSLSLESANGSDPFGAVLLTDNETLATGDERFTFTELSLDEISTVALTEDDDCSTPLATVSFEE